jgi:5-methylcytosine-specific restriction endonuclease McrA
MGARRSRSRDFDFAAAFPALAAGATTPALVDRLLFRVTRGGGAIDLAIGDALVELLRGDRLIRLGATSLSEYALEILGEKVRTVYQWYEVARAVADKPLLRRAVACGAVTARKAILLSKVAVGEAQAAWVVLAMELTERELRDRIHDLDREAPDLLEIETMVIRLSPRQRDRVNRAISFAKILIGLSAPEWRCIEVLCQEFLGSWGSYRSRAWDRRLEKMCEVGREGEEKGPESEEERERKYRKWIESWAGRLGAVQSRLAAYEEAMAVVDVTDEELERDRTDEELVPLLHERILRLIRARRKLDEPFGRLARIALDLRIWESFGYPTVELYCRERLGISASTLRTRAWLERRMAELPELRAALESGRISYTKAVLVARRATRADVTAILSEVESMTYQDSETRDRDRTEREERASGRKRIWSPRDTAVTIRLALDTMRRYARRAGGERIGEDEAAARIADHFVKTWTEPIRVQLRRVPPERWELMMRFGGICARPGCRLAAVHIHHVIYRSRGGGEERTNLIPLCAACHLKGQHAGNLLIEGRSGKRMVWTLRTNLAMPEEEWIQEHGGPARRSDGR